MCPAWYPAWSTSRGLKALFQSASTPARREKTASEAAGAGAGRLRYALHHAAAAQLQHRWPCCRCPPTAWQRCDAFCAHRRGRTGRRCAQWCGRRCGHWSAGCSGRSSAGSCRPDRARSRPPVGGRSCGGQQVHERAIAGGETSRHRAACAVSSVPSTHPGVGHQPLFGLAPEGVGAVERAAGGRPGGARDRAK